MRRNILVGLCVVLGLVLPIVAQTPAPLQLGIIAATDATVVGEITSSASVAIQVSGTWVGTMAFEASVDQQTWASVPVIRQSTSALVTTTTSVDTFSLQNPGYGWIRVRGSSYTSGTAVVSMRGGILATSKRPTPTQPGTIAAAQGAVTTEITAYPSAALQVSGTWSGTLIFEASVDSRAWATLQVARQSTGAVVTTTTSNDTFGMFNPGFAWVRVRCSSYSSGTAIVSIRGGYNTNTPVSVTTVGSMWKRTGTTIAPVVSGDAVTVDGLLTASAGVASTDITLTTGSALRSGTTVGNTVLLQGYDTSGTPQYRTLATITSAAGLPTIAIPTITGLTTFTDGLNSKAGSINLARSATDSASRRNWGFITELNAAGDLVLRVSATNITDPIIAVVEFESDLSAKFAGTVSATGFLVGATPGIDKTCSAPITAATFSKGILTAMTCTDPGPEPYTLTQAMAEIHELRQQVAALQANGGLR